MSNQSWMDVMTAGYVEPSKDPVKPDDLDRCARILCERYNLQLTDQNLADARAQLMAYEKSGAKVSVK